MNIQRLLNTALLAGALLLACAGGDGPSLDSATPSEGPTEGGTEVVLRGEFLSPFSTVAFGDVPASSVTWVDWSTISVIAPPGEPGAVDIVLTHYTDRAVLRDGFTYIVEPPVDTDCFVTITPGFGADEIDVTASVTVAFNVPVDMSAVVGAIRMIRLGDDAPVPVEVDVVDDSTVSVRPQGSLSFFADYEIWVDSVPTDDGATTCAADESVFSTRSPVAAPRTLRPGPIHGFAVIGDVGIAASSSYRGLQLYDLSTPATPVLTGEILTEQTPLGIQVEGDRAYVPSGAGGVLIFDVTTPEAPALLGVAGTPGVAVDVVPFTRGAKRYLAVADGPGGLRFIDVTQAEGAKDVSFLFPAGNPATFVSSVDMRGTLVAVAEGQLGTFALVDATNLAAPAVLVSRSSEAVPGTFNSAIAVWDVALGDGTLYAGLLSAGIEAFDVVDPANPVFIDHVLGPQGVCAAGCPDAIRSMVVLGDTASTERLFTSSAMTGAVRVALVGSELISEVLPVPGRVNWVLPTLDHVWLGTERGLAVFEATAPDGATPLFAESGGWGLERDVLVAHDHLYTTSSSRGLETYELSSPLDPSVLALAPTAGVEADVGLISVYAVGDLLLVGDGRAGLALFDASTPANPQFLSQLFQADTVADLVTSTESALACGGNQELWVVGFSDPSSPTKQVFAIPPLVGGCHSLARVGDMLYMAGPLGLGIYDVSDELNPVFVDSLTLPAVDILVGLAAHGEHLYATTVVPDFEGINGVAQRLVVFDVSDPAAPVRVFKGPDLGGVGEVEVHADKLFLGGGREGVWVFGLTDPAEPQLEGRIDFPGVVGNMAVASVADTTILYAAQAGGGVGASVLGRVTLDD